MSEEISVTGLVATTPRFTVTDDGLKITAFRLASSERRYDERAGKWVEGEANWYTVTAYRDLATHMSESIEKGHRILVMGKLHIRDWDNGERQGTSVEIEAYAVGHDLSWGTSNFTRKVLVKETPVSSL